MNGTETPLSSLTPSPADEPGGEPAAPRRRSSWVTFGLVIAFLILVGLAIFLPPLINLGHYKRVITASMSLALGRPVYVGDMQLRLLPTPGIVMSDLNVEEDPAFGYEPALHANSVVASLRLSSLWRGRLEVSSISLDEASVNLVRNNAGQWNIGSVLLRASQIPNAPTAERHAGPTPRFPYIEATDTRINFREGVEKRPFSLFNAEFAMWQANNGDWRVRLSAQPVRTDRELHLSDAGELQMQGSLRRAATLDAMPLNLTAEWSGAQLGQVSRILAGFDSGWRGDLDATATVQGQVGDLAIHSRVRIANLRRLEFQPASPVDVDATCKGSYQHAEHSLTGLTCFWPVNPGHLLLTAGQLNFTPLGGDLQLEMNRIPAQFPVALLGLLRPRFANVIATGSVNGSFELNFATQPRFSGHADAAGIALTSGSHIIPLPTLHFMAQVPPVPRRKGRSKTAAQPLPTPAADAVLLSPVSVPFGAPEPLVVEGRLTASAFDLHLTGQAALDRLVAAGASFGLLGNAMGGVSGTGPAELNTTTSGTWLAALATPPVPPVMTGTIRVQNAQFQPAFLHASVQIDSADLLLSPEERTWQNVVLHYRGLAVRGSLHLPAVCDQPPCPATFALQSPSLDAAALENVLTTPPASGLFGQFFSKALGSSTPPSWPPLQGTVQTALFQLGRLAVRDATIDASVDGSTLTIGSFDGAALGGALHASGGMELLSGVPHWTVAAQLTGAKVADTAALFHEHWGAGLLSGDVKLAAFGYHLPQLLSSAAGVFHATWQKGSMGQQTSALLPLSHFDQWIGWGTIAQSTLTLTSGSLTHDGRTVPVVGAITFDRRLALTLQTRKGPVTIAGTLGHPTSTSAQP